MDDILYSSCKPYIILLGTGLTLYVLVAWLHYKRSVLARIKSPESPSWLIGNLLQFYSSWGNTSAAVQWHRQYGTVVRFKGFFFQDRLQVADPAAVAHLFNAGPYTYEKETIMKPRYGIMFGPGLLSANGSMHHKLRRIMLPAFGTQHIASLAPIFEKCAHDIRDRWTEAIKAGGGTTAVDLGTDSSFGLLNAIGEAAFAYDFDVFNKGGATPLFQALAYLDSLSNTRTYKQILLECVIDLFPAWMVHLVLLLPIKNGRGLKEQLQVLDSTAKDLFAQGVADAELECSTRKDLLSTLVRANMQQDAKFQLEAREVQSQLLTFVIAGWGTVLSVFCSLMARLATHPTVQERLREEMASLGDHPTIEQLQVAEYLNAVLSEAIRMVDVTSLERIATRNDVIPLSKPIELLDGSWTSHIPVKRGQSISISIQAMNFDTDRFGPDASEFRPERWLGTDGERLRSYTGFGPRTWNGLANFGGGTRACIGNKFAMVELRIFTHALLTSFRFSPGVEPWAPQATLL